MEKGGGVKSIFPKIPCCGRIRRGPAPQKRDEWQGRSGILNKKEGAAEKFLKKVLTQGKPRGKITYVAEMAARS